MEMTEGMETEVLPDEEISDGNEYPGEDGIPSDEDPDMPETSGTDDEGIENDTTDTGTGETEDIDADSSEIEDGLPEDETDVDGTDIPVENLNVTGSILILPEGCELNLEEIGQDENIETGPEEETGFSSEQFDQISEQLEQLAETVSVQNDVLYGGTAVVCLILGALLGVLLIQGFRLRRV